MTLTFNQLRNLKDRLPEGSIRRMASEFNVSVETIRNYFGGANFKRGESMGIHIEPGPGGGLVHLDDPTIYHRACELIIRQRYHS